MGELIIRLNYNFPGDIGSFAPFFLNHFILQPGEACFLGPNEPHAYLYGDCIECMACSDNTIRAGLSPKFKDTNTLVKSLTYRMSSPEENKFQPVQDPKDSSVIVYDPPAVEFSVQKITIGETIDATISGLPTCSIMIVIQGAATVTQGSDEEFKMDKLARGIVAFIPADKTVEINVSEVPFVAFRAYTDESGVDKL